MKLKDFCTLMEDIAPRELACSWDNVGLLVEPDHEDIHKVLLALDNREEVAMEAAQMGADLVLTHHPGFLHGTKKVTYTDPDTRAVRPAGSMILWGHCWGCRTFAPWSRMVWVV